MIRGVVNAAHEAIISLPVQGPSGQSLEFEAVVDTGFSEFLTLPPALVTELQLPPVSNALAILADGSEATFDVYGVTVLWDGRARDVVAYAADTIPLVGMALLESHSLYVEVEDGGRVVIQARE